MIDEDPYADDLTEDTAEDPLSAADPLAGLAEAAAVSVPRHAWQGRGPAMDADGRIDADVHCKACGYNLRGQLLENTCPECGASVEWSARGDRLAYHDPRWVGSLARGMLWLMITVGAWIALGIAEVAVSIAIFRHQMVSISSGSSSGGIAQSIAIQQIVSLLFSLVAFAILITAVWQLSAPEPARQDESPASSRKLFRWGMIGYTALNLAGGGLYLLHDTAGGLVSLAGLVVFLVAFFAMCVYLRGLALRIPDSSLAGQTRTVMWGMAGCVGLFTFAAVLVLLFENASVSAGRSAGALAAGGGCLGVIALAVFGIWGFILTILYWGAFRRAHRQAASPR